ncbi:MAG TPA: ABC-F family ATP-binding cassette domain-containing protein [Polyangiales bacterium]|jgi:ATP-binding cassette subfamily F protein 3|nr:ABC-F family ATP-binding cassette domain-containing protein [Polyangiales bacterium]
MSLAVLEKVALGFGKKTIVEGLDLRIAAGDRIGLIGPNGSGKTSLLRLLAHEQAPDFGSVVMSRGTRLGYLPQDIAIRDDKPLLPFVMASVQGRAALDAELAACEAELAEAEKDPGDGELLMSIAEKLSDLHERIAHYEMHYTEHEAMRILSGLGFANDDRTRKLSELSGGWKMRAVLASLLFQKPDLLLLDEPTNHLDMPSVTWLADFMKAYQRAFILICHDREFLNEQIERIVSFEVEGVRTYSGNYERYLKLREEEEIILENKAKNIAREREQTERFINRFRAQANKARAVQSRVKALDKMEEVETYQKRKVMRIKFPPTERTVAEPLRLEHVSKSYGERVVLNDVTLKVNRGERVGIIGVNGAGKTTLLRMIAGEIESSGGQIVLGNGVNPGYYAQHHADTLHRESTIFEELSHADATAGVTRVRSVAGAFLFSDDDVEKKIAVLSGGERARVALARLLIKPGNLLLMDEPTNHLDLASSEALAESLSGYDGTLIFVSHNRSFIHKLATRIWNVENGTVETYPGTLDEYMDSCRRRQEETERRSNGGGKVAAAPQPTAKPKLTPAAPPPSAAKPAAPAQPAKPAQESAAQKASKNRRQKLEKSVAEVEAKIAQLETLQKSRSEQLADPEVYADKPRSTKLLEEFRAAQEELEKLTARWEREQGELEQLA